MAKKTRKKATASGSRAGRMSPAQARRSLRHLDRDLIKLANQRAILIRRLVQSGDPEAAETAETALGQTCLESISGLNKGPLENSAIRAMFRELLSGTRAQLAPTCVVYLGPPYSFSHLAAVERFGESAELLPVATIAAVFDAVNRGQAHFGLVPVENSTDGRVADTLDMFARLPVRICGEVRLYVHHHLLGRCSRAEVREVYSKPQALSQCRGWLARQLPDARTVEMASTAAAAKLAAEKAGAAAIASQQAGVNYGLDVIAANIEDNCQNMTRFAVIGDAPPRRTGQDKTSLMFEVMHQPGALADAMTIFKRNELNLTWIESFPMVGIQNEYLFFVEFEGHRDESRATRALASLARKTVRLVVLGSYPATQPVG